MTGNYSQFMDHPLEAAVGINPELYAVGYENGYEEMNAADMFDPRIQYIGIVTGEFQISDRGKVPGVMIYGFRPTLFGKRHFEAAVLCKDYNNQNVPTKEIQVARLDKLVETLSKKII